MMADSRSMKPEIPNFLVDRCKRLPVNATIEIHMLRCGTAIGMDDEAVAVPVKSPCAVTTYCAIDLHGFTFHLNSEINELTMAKHDK